MKIVVCLLMICLSSGVYAQRNVRRDKDFRHKCRLAARGDDKAVRSIYEYMSNGVAGYYDRSLKVLMQASAHGAPEASYVLGNCLFRRSRDSSIMYYTAGVATHDATYAPRCAFALGDIYARGLPPELMGGVSPLRDTALAVSWYRKFLTYDIPYVDRINVTAKILIYTKGGHAALQYLDSVNRDGRTELSDLKEPLQLEINGYR